MGRIISIANQKGGSGKTSLCVNLGAALALTKKKVLILDIDPQRHATFCLGIKDEGISVSVYDVISESDQSVYDAVIETPIPNLHLLPGDQRLVRLEIFLIDLDKREFSLKTNMGKIHNDYDFVLIDCPPSLGLLFINALTYSKEVFIPINASDFLSLEGLSRLLETIQSVRSKTNRALELTGIILNNYDTRTKLSKELSNIIGQQENLRGRIFNTFIHRTVKIAESASFGLPIIKYYPRSKASLDYQNLTKEVLKHGKDKGNR